jgi:hypothetical protein
MEYIKKKITKTSLVRVCTRERLVLKEKLCFFEEVEDKSRATALAGCLHHGIPVNLPLIMFLMGFRAHLWSNLGRGKGIRLTLCGKALSV